MGNDTSLPPSNAELYAKALNIERAVAFWRSAAYVLGVAAAILTVIVFLQGNSLNDFQDGRDARNCRDIEIAKTFDLVDAIIIASVTSDDGAVSEATKELAAVGSLEQRFKSCNGQGEG